MSMDVITVGVVCADVMASPVKDVPGRGELAFIERVDVHLGGLAGVTAATLSKLGARAAVIGRVGSDGFGDFLVNTLSGHGVAVDRITRTAEQGTAATMVLIHEDGERSFLHAKGANALINETDVDFYLVKQARILHWGGPALNPGLDGEPIGRVMKRARALGVKTSMDTIYDGSGVWFPHIEHALPHLDIVMSSLEEARHYTGKNTPDEIADFYLSFGPEVVLIKLGPDGVLAKSAGERHEIPAHGVPVVDTTGAGDAACGGFLYGILQDWSLERCARLANAVGGMTVQAMGGAGAAITRESAVALMEGGP